MRKDKLVRDYFGTQLFITTSGHFSTPALMCALQEIGSQSVMFSIDYPFESIPNGCVWYDEYIHLNGRDTVDVGRNNALDVFSKLTTDIHGLKKKSQQECGVGGLGLRKGDEDEREYGIYNKDWSTRLTRK